MTVGERTAGKTLANLNRLRTQGIVQSIRSANSMEIGSATSSELPATR